MLDTAWHAGINCFDTARAYGGAESILGQWRSDHLSLYAEPLFVSKFAPAAGHDPVFFVRRSADTSRRTLGCNKIDAYLAHQAEDIFLPGVVDTLRALRDEGKISAFGVSVYEPEQLKRALTIEDVSVVQVPASLLDQRFHLSGLLEKCAERDITVFARSLFLQGVLFMPQERIPHYLEPVVKPLATLRNLCDEWDCSLAGLAFAAIRAMPGINSAVIGVADQQQLTKNLAASGCRPPPEAVAQALKLFDVLPNSVIDPRQWPKPVIDALVRNNVP